ncbi:MAG: trehalase family glycosidase [bacterium]|nr:trehalase family glycosidase [bacterium]
MNRSRPVSAATGWNTWDFRSYNTIVYLEDGMFTFKVQLSVYDPDADVHHTRFRWPQMPVRGPHAPDGSYWSYTFSTPSAQYAVEAAGRGRELDVAITPLTQGDRCRVVVGLLPAGEEAVEVRDKVLRTRRWWVTPYNLHRPEEVLFFISVDYVYLINTPGEPCALHVGARRCRGRWPTLLRRIARAKECYAREELCGEDGLARALMAIPRAVTWNTIYDARWTGLTTQISRDWGVDWNGSYNFPWDQCFLGYLAHTVSVELSRANFRAILASATEEGFLPNYYTSFGVKAFDRSQPPIGGYLVWKTALLTGDQTLVKECYPALARWHAWWRRARDPQGSGLLAWGSNPTPVYEFPHLKLYNPVQQHEHICALYEAGMDNFPVMNQVPFDKRAHTLAADCVALNSLYVLDCEALAWMAAQVGDTHAAQRYRREAAAHAQRMRARLYDPRSGLYCIRCWDGRFIRDVSAINFYPLAAGVPTEEQAHAMVARYLLDPELFWGEYVLSVTALNYPASKNNNYWAGRIWPPTNFIIYEGLKRYGLDEVAAAFATKSYRMFEKNWAKANLICENYHMLTGEGGDVWNSDTGYAWGALLAMCALQELIDVEPWSDHLRVGTRSQQSWGVVRYRVGDDTYRVRSAYDGLQVWRNGMLWLCSTSPVVVRCPRGADTPGRVFLSADRPGTLRMYGARPGARILVQCGAHAVICKVDERGVAVLPYDAVSQLAPPR